MAKKSKTKALLMFSGGLDSMLAGMVLKEQKIEVLGLTFTSPFFGAEVPKKSAKKIGIKLKVVDFTGRHLEMLKNPKHGYGKNMNPCIDCHALMFRMAKEIMIKEKFDFIATGEVLGERPMSQNKGALDIIEKESELEGFLLRPLSAKLLPETEVEKAGKINREKLLAILGKNRKPQLELVKKYNIKEFPTPSGGCLLTEKIFSENLRKLFSVKPKADGNDIELIKYGRQVWKKGVYPHTNSAGELVGSNKKEKNLSIKKSLPKKGIGVGVKFIIGRNQEENERLKKLKKPKDFLAEAKEVPGPIILVRNYSKDKIDRNHLEKELLRMLLKYNAKAREIKNISVKWL